MDACPHIARGHDGKPGWLWVEATGYELVPGRCWPSAGLPTSVVCWPRPPRDPARHRPHDPSRPGGRVPRSVTETHPVALAVARALNLPPRHPGVFIRVGSDWFSIQAGSFYESHTLPPGSEDWIRAYAACRPHGPIAFTFTTGWGCPS